MLGDVGQQLVGQVREGAVLDLRPGELGAHHLGRRRGAGHGEDAALDDRPLQLLVDLDEGVLVVGARGVGIGPHEVVRRRRDLAAERL